MSTIQPDRRSRAVGGGHPAATHVAAGGASEARLSRFRHRSVGIARSPRDDHRSSRSALHAMTPHQHRSTAPGDARREPQGDARDGAIVGGMCAGTRAGEKQDHGTAGSGPRARIT